MRLHYSDTHERVQVGDQTITPDGMYIKIIAIYKHSGAILIEVLSDDCVLRRRGATADEIGADWRGEAPPLFGDKNYFSLRPASDFVTSPSSTFLQDVQALEKECVTSTGRICTSKPETQHLHASSVLTFRGTYSPATDFAALELRLMRDASFIIPIDEADRQRLLDGLDLLLNRMPRKPEQTIERAAIQELATRLGKV